MKAWNVRGWFTRHEAIGPTSPELAEEFAKEATRAEWNDMAPKRDYGAKVCRVSKCSADSGREQKRQMGCPAVPEQLLSVCQTRIAGHCEGWPASGALRTDRLVALIGMIVGAGWRAKKVSQLIAQGESIEVGDGKWLAALKLKLNAEAHMLRVGAWESLCNAAGHQNICCMIQSICDKLRKAYPARG